MRWILALIVTVVLAAPSVAQPRLGLAGTEPTNGGYDAVLEAMDAARIDLTSLTLFWDEFDFGGSYIPETDWPAIANQVYPGRDIALTLTIAVIDTVADRRPEDLRHLPWADPLVIARFTTFLDRVLADMPDVRIVTLAIGNEVDVFLNASDWTDFATFFEATRNHVHASHPDLPIGTTITWDGLRENASARSIADLGDGWFVNWYPLGPGFEVLPAGTFAPTLTRMRQMAGDSPIYLTEAGHPSGGCGGTAAGQEAFVRTVANAPGIELAMFVWLHDLPPGTAEGYATYYGIEDACFIDYLATLGLRTYSGFDKPAFAFLRNR